MEGGTIFGATLPPIDLELTKGILTLSNCTIGSTATTSTVFQVDKGATLIINSNVSLLRTQLVIQPGATVECPSTTLKL